jgi:hypothetical protein
VAEPWKKLTVEQIGLILKSLNTLAQIKVWLYHYSRENGGDERKSFLNQDTVCEATGLSRSAITHARTWLVANGWLAVIGYRPIKHGTYAVREYRCCFPDGKDLSIVGQPRLPDACDLGNVEPNTQAPQSLTPRHGGAAEVDSIEVDSPARPPEVINPNQLTNQPTKRRTPPTEATPVLGFWDEAYIEDVSTGEPLTPMAKEAKTRQHLKACFPMLRDPSPQDLRLMFLVVAHCESNSCFAESLLNYQREHFTTKDTLGMVSRDIRHLHNALLGSKVSQTNGLMAQYKIHWEGSCPDCQRRLKKEQKAMVSDPMSPHYKRGRGY